jgi:hypothetical protein
MRQNVTPQDGRQVTLLSPFIDGSDQIGDDHHPFCSYFFQAGPELFFETDTGA